LKEEKQNQTIYSGSTDMTKQKALKFSLKSKILKRFYRYKIGRFILQLKNSTFVSKQVLSQYMIYPKFHYPNADIAIKNLVHRIKADYITEDERLIIYAKHRGQL
jgi:hypothetical protein